MATTIATNHATPATMPMTTLSKNQAARARTSAARTRVPNEEVEPDFSSIRQRVRPPKGRGQPIAVAAASGGAAGRTQPCVADGRAARELRAGKPVAADRCGVRIARGRGVAPLDEHEARS